MRITAERSGRNWIGTGRTWGRFTTLSRRQSSAALETKEGVWLKSPADDEDFLQVLIEMSDTVHARQLAS